MGNIDNSVKLAGQGEISAKDNVDSHIMDLLKVMWKNRVYGFNLLNIPVYLRDFSPQAQFVFEDKVFAANLAAFKRKVWWLFLLGRLLALFGRRLRAEVVDAVVEGSNRGYITHFIFIVFLGKNIRNQYNCTQTIEEENGRLKFKTFRLWKIPREQWPLAMTTNNQGDTVLVRYARE